MSAPQDNWVEQAALAEYGAAAAWLEAHAGTLPDDVQKTLRIAMYLGQQVAQLKQRARGRFRQMQRALGITPSSEKRSPKKEDGANAPVDPVARLRQCIAKSERLGCWHGGLAKKHQGIKAAAAKKLKRLEAMQFTPEEEAEIAEEAKRATEASMRRAQQGEGADPALAPAPEPLMRGMTSMVHHGSVDCPVDEDDLPKGASVQQSFVQSRQRIDFTFQLTVLDVQVEKKAVKSTDGSVRLYAGDVQDIGPAKMRVTWRFLAHLVMLVSQYAMPLHRFARLTSTSAKSFSAAEMSRYYQFVARRFAPIYNHLGLALARAQVWSGDDTPSLVLEVSRHAATPAAEPPWQAYASPAQAQQTVASEKKPSLGSITGCVWPFVSPRKNGKGNKSSLNTTVVSGRVDAQAPNSLVVFYRSHFGGLGNILDTLLQHRPPDLQDVVVQSDLSTVNLVAPEFQAHFSVQRAGCASHARRPFALHKDDDPELCDDILYLFAGIALFEKTLDEQGRNAVNTQAVRDVDERACWEELRDTCTQAAAKWSPRTDLGEGARYLLRHYDKLTYYLSDVRVSAHNNFSERLLRMEKLIGNNALFRQSLEGRFALDIMRTVLQTAIAAEVDLQAYIIWVLQMPPESVAADPGAFTPVAFGQWWDEQQAIESLNKAAS